MSTQPTALKPSSRWGSFLQQAVAGVESRLDTILADEDTTSTRPKDAPNQQSGKTENSSASAKPTSSADISRSLSRSRKNDRLQERLAKAVVNRSNTKLVESSTGTATVQPLFGSPSSSIASPRTSIDSKAEESALEPGSEEPSLEVTSLITNSLHDDAHTPELVQPIQNLTENGNSEDQAVPRSSIQSHMAQSSRSASDMNESGLSNSLASENIVKEASVVAPAPHEETLAQMRSDYESAELRRQEETHIYLERIDALQAKLQYLTNEAIANARKTTSDAQGGVAEAKLAAKDEKIALLMEEGQKLSQMELKHLSAIRNLRAKSIEDAKQLSHARKTVNDYQNAIQVAEEREKRVEMVERNEVERSKVLQRVEKELEKSKAENQSFATLMVELRQQVAQAKASYNAEDANKYRNMLESEQSLVSGLRDDLASMKIEKELAVERHRARVQEVHDKTERERERTKIVDQELRGEIRVLESRLESYRARAEEVSSGDVGVSQVKLLRQMETLQTQYALATENWQGIESSLLSRITNLEKERDEIERKDFDVRRKAREASAKHRRLEEDLHKSMSTIQHLEQRSTEQEKQLATFKHSLSKAKEDTKAAKLELSQEKDTWQSRLNERIEEIKNEIQGDGNPEPETLYQTFGSESPLFSSRKKSVADRVSPVQQRYQTSPGLSLAAGAVPFRRSSAQPSATSGFATPQRHDSIQNIAHQPLNGGPGIPETPSIQTEQHNDFFDGVITPATPERTINDMISVSTAAAGPSVQLVERMSAAVRRLESEKASNKDELERLSTQRDEAREQLVALMNEIEERRSADDNIQHLQTELTEINKRYQTALEMLGEKSELVEELQADVADLKQMYKDLVENTMR